MRLENRAVEDPPVGGKVIFHKQAIRDVVPRKRQSRTVLQRGYFRVRALAENVEIQTSPRAAVFW